MLNGTRAAQYVRMSTDMQRYSISNQIDTIARYAASRGLTIVKSYSDAGKSGLRFNGRDGLKSLIGDITSGHADYKVVLVYDVSRWGRFQDSDESAYYEFICKNAGVSVEYCAEPFENDGSLPAAILKSIKRVMAGEYSRELSNKVFIGQCHIVRMGFRSGGTPGYGYRRALVDEGGDLKRILASGEWKSIQTERVILVPGPQNEIDVVREIFRLFIEERKTFKQISQQLNASSIQNSFRRRWTAFGIKSILKNEKYIGNNVYNRTSSKLGRRWWRNPRHQWVRGDHAFCGIISRDLFDKANFLIEWEHRSLSDATMLNILSSVWCRYGYLKASVLRASGVSPAPCTYLRRFGSILNAYRLIGYGSGINNSRVNNRLKNRYQSKALYQDIAACIQDAGATLRPTNRRRFYIVNEELRVSARVIRLTTSHNSQRWRIGYVTNSRPDILVTARLQPETEKVVDYYLLPFSLTPRQWFTFAEGKRSNLDTFRFPSLEILTALLERVSIENLVARSALDDCQSVDGFSENDLLLFDFRNRLASGLQKLIATLTATHSINLLQEEGVTTIPRIVADGLRMPAHCILATPNTQGETLLQFAVARSFLTRLLINKRTKRLIGKNNPELASEFTSLFASVSSSGPLNL